MSTSEHWLDPAFEAIAIDDEGRACTDIPDQACQEEAGNFFKHVGSLALSKAADGLIDPKLVLSWLMTAVGAPAALVGLLVPIREAGALLPQLFTAGALRALPQRKWAWTVGSLIQGGSALAIAAAAAVLTGAAAGCAILAGLTVLALARSVCSVCYKDVLGKTVDKSRRGTATGLATSIAAAVTIVFALTLLADWVDRRTLVLLAIALAGGAWILAGLLFSTLAEAPGATEGGQAAFTAALDNLTYLRTEPQLRRFILARGLLTATALAPPFMLTAAAGDGKAFAALGLLILASAAASLLSGYIWGRRADRSSRKVLMHSAVLAAITLGATTALAVAGFLSDGVALPLALFALMVAYQGVRLGRATHLVDMADQTTRAPFTAIANTAIGLLLFAGAGFSALAAVTGPGVVLGVMTLMCVLAVLVAAGLEEVQRQ